MAHRALYRALVKAVDPMVPLRLRPMWEHSAGPKTVFFWAPTIKWSLVIAGIADLARPVETLSPSQSAALTATGFIWARYCLVIVPKNYYLFSVNAFLGSTGLTQLTRIIKYTRLQWRRSFRVLGGAEPICSADLHPLYPLSPLSCPLLPLTTGP